MMHAWDAHRTGSIAAGSVVTTVFAGGAFTWWLASASAGSELPQWPAYAFGVIALFGLYCVFAPLLAWWPFGRLAGLRTTLAKLQSEGQGLHEQVNSVARGEAGQLQKPCEAWATTVARALEEGGESFRVGHFLDEQHYGDTFFATQYAEHSRLNNWMRRRLSRLGEIIRDL